MKFICYGKCIRLYVEKMDRDKYLWKKYNYIYFFFIYCCNLYIIEI